MKKRLIRNKSGQIHLPFNMLFSIFLIIIFIVVAFIAIRYFLNMSDNIQVSRFVDNLQRDVDTLWQSTGSDNFPFEEPMPPKVELVCFLDADSSRKGTYSEVYNELVKSSDHNLYFYPRKSTGLKSTFIEHINLTSITDSKNPYCFENENGKVSMTLYKEFHEALIRIE